MTDWWAPYVGLPFGEGPGEVTCWSLVRRIYADQLGIDLPSYGEVSAGYLAALARRQAAEARAEVSDLMADDRIAGQWRDVTLPFVFDVVRMLDLRSRRVGHVGVMLDHCRLIHAEQATGAAVVSVTHPTVASRIVDYRRFVG